MRKDTSPGLSKAHSSRTFYFLKIIFFFKKGKSIVCEILSQLTHYSNQILLTISQIDNNVKVTCLSSENPLKVYLTLMIKNCSSECSFAIMRLIRNSKPQVILQISLKCLPTWTYFLALITQIFLK